MSNEILLVIVIVFVLRVVNSALSTIRIIALTRDQRVIAFILGFIESIAFAVTIGSVVANLSNVYTVFAYALGFSVGQLIGQLLESRFISGFVTVNIVATENGRDLALALRRQGYGVTETIGEGTGGKVTVLRSVMIRQHVPRILETIYELNNTAFVTVEEARAVHRGWMRAARNRQ